MLTLEERIYGFTKLWSDAGRYFAFWDKLKDLDWDGVYKKYLPGIIAAENTLAYYGEMKKVAALLKDGHTQVILPSHLMPPYDLPLGTSYIEGKHILMEVPQQHALHLYGEVLEIDGIEINTYLEQNVYPYIWHENEIGVFKFGLLGYMIGCIQGEKPFTIKTQHGIFSISKTDICEQVSVEVSVEHPELNTMETVFKSSTHTIKLTQDNIAYICIPSFKEGENLKKEFYHNLELLEKCKGFIIDLRENEGGGCLGASAVAQAFIEGEVEGTLQKVPYFLGDIKANSMSNHMFYKVDSDKRCHNDCPLTLNQPLVILSDSMTVSAAEEFLAYFKGKGRGIIVGTHSMGTNGSPIIEALPGGGYYKICTMQTILSDGTEFINRGIEPDIFVENTLEDLKNNFDRILDKGLEVIRNSLA